ncbi:MAG: replicative DNA helicase [Candidatus Spechtbacterales bacterium]|nr:replicative DNA helicase [Candidatus Spechtbacterales bacterium]
MAKQNTGRIPPQDIEAEQSVLGSILMDKEAFFKVADVLNPNDFYLNDHKMVFETMTELAEKGKPLDILSVSSKMKEKGKLKTVGGQSALTKLVNSVPSASHIAHYADIVHKKALLRKMIEASYHIAELGYKEEDDIDILLDEAEKKVFNISQRINSQSFSPLKGNLEEAFDRIDKLHKNKGEMRGIPTGFNDLDEYLAGLQKSDLIILAARPSLGKSALAMDIARKVSVDHKIPVGIFSLEMSRDQIVDRMIASEAGVDLWRLRTGRLSTKGELNDFVKIQNALGNLSEASIYIDDGLTSSVLQMRAMARRLQAERGLGLLIVDYLQLIQPRSASDSMVQQITEISRSLKALARELDVPVLALSQLSRAIEQRPNKTPKLSDLRDSGSIEQDADVVLFISRDLRGQDPEKENIAEIHIAKHRNGPIGKIDLYFDKRSASFKNLDKRHGNDATPIPSAPTADEVDIDDIPS